MEKERKNDRRMMNLSKKILTHLFGYINGLSSEKVRTQQILLVVRFGFMVILS